MKILLTDGAFSCDSKKVESKNEKILTLVNNFDHEIPTLLNEADFSDAQKIKSQMPYPGILLSPSGSSGEKSWILHSWNNLKERIKNKKAPTHRSLIFLSLEHAAGVEGFFSHYINGIDCGIFSPSLSVAEALRLFKLHKPLTLSTTSSTFLRFISFPELRKWIKENIIELSLGGEDINDQLQLALRSEFNHIKVKSVYGTTETWSITTDQSFDLNWHHASDEKIKLDFSNNNLTVKTPYLFSHYWNGDRFVEHKAEYWLTGDVVDLSDTGSFKIRSRRFAKYHGLKVFPLEWELKIKEIFSLEWAQVQESMNSSFTLTLPLKAQSEGERIKAVIREKAWPIRGIFFHEGPLVTTRGKIAQKSWIKISSSEVRNLNKENYQFSYLEDYTWGDDSEFMFFQSSSGFLFYKINPCRLSLQYCLNDISELADAFKLINDEVIIRLSGLGVLDSSVFKSLGVYYVWEMDLINWRPKIKSSLITHSRNESMGNKFDYLLKEKEKKIVSTLSDSIVYYTKNEDAEGVCAFRIVDDSYYGIYLSNNHLPMRDFWHLCSQALAEAKGQGAKRAMVRVDDSNSSAKFVHEVLGFKKSQQHYSLWSNIVYE